MIGTREIELPSGHIALIDKVDWCLARPYSWYATVAKSSDLVYVVGHDYEPSNRAKKVKLHRIILGALPGTQVDHINHNALDNRRANLRRCTSSQNMANRRAKSNSTTGYKGVYFHKGARKWAAAIVVNGRRRHLGLFSDPWEAAQAYNVALLAEFGDFAFINVRHPEPADLVSA